MKRLCSCLLMLIMSTLLMMSCRASKMRNSKVLTDLGSDNEAVAQRFERYKAKASHCKQVSESSADYRVILAGFGPFSGVDQNTSSLVAMNFASLVNSSPDRLVNPEINLADADGIIRQDLVTINGRKVAVCAVSTSVIWDLAAAIYLYEAEIFRPDLIIMAGMDGGNDIRGTWEHHATNVAKSLRGYEHNGAQSTVTPKADSPSSETVILPNGPEFLKMTWDAERLVTMTRPIVRKRFPNFDVQTSDQETPGNYLCNNVSYVVLAGLAGYELPLAGGKMNVKVHDLSTTRAGFFHYPWTSKRDLDAIASWVKVMSAAIGSEMSRRS